MTDSQKFCRALVMRSGLRARTMSSWRKGACFPHSPGIFAFSLASSPHHRSHSSDPFSTSLARVPKPCTHESPVNHCHQQAPDLHKGAWLLATSNQSHPQGPHISKVADDVPCICMCHLDGSVSGAGPCFSRHIHSTNAKRVGQNV